ncbi:hypothetical protein [Phenylobacterium sp.]|uniref:hypothetical protein n=1 Tax=Phenylobacterium sp. TaxID=1871053 RepID=UPI0025CC2C83|nr:hypothetical protein [Phenylobacterium sp.]
MIVLLEWLGVSLVIAGMIRGAMGGPVVLRFWGTPGPISKRAYIWLLVWSAVLAAPVVWFISLVSHG